MTEPENQNTENADTAADTDTQQAEAGAPASGGDEQETAVDAFAAADEQDADTEGPESAENGQQPG